MIILTIKRLNSEVVDDFYIKGSTVTVSPKVFMNTNIFLQWFGNFNESIPSSTKRPIFFRFDGFTSLYNDDIIKKSI